MIVSSSVMTAGHHASAGSIIAGLAMIATLLALGVVLLRRLIDRLRALSATPSGEKLALRSATRALDQARKAFAHDVKRARAQAAAAGRSYRRGVASAEKRLAKIQTPRFLGKVGRIKVFEDRVVTPDGVHPLDHQVHAIVESAGVIAVTRRYTLTRFALLGPLSLFAPKAVEHDHRELYFLVEHPEWTSVVKLKPDQALTARKLCAQLNLLARQASRISAVRAQMTAEAVRDLNAARMNRAGLDKAEAGLTQAFGAFTKVDELRRAVSDQIALCDRTGPAIGRARRSIEQADRLRPARGNAAPLPNSGSQQRESV